jgi:hypothetical protein
MREKLLKDQVYVNNSHLGEMEENIRLVISDIFSSKIFIYVKAMRSCSIRRGTSF